MAVQAPLTKRILEDEILKKVIARRGKLKNAMVLKEAASLDSVSSRSEMNIAQNQREEIKVLQGTEPLNLDELSLFGDDVGKESCASQS